MAGLLLAVVAMPACGNGGNGGSGFAAGGTSSGGTGSGAATSSGTGTGAGFSLGGALGSGVVLDSDSGQGSGQDGGVTSGMLMGTIRDFKYYDNTPSTNADFENPPYAVTGSWDDRQIVTNTLGSDNKPVYNPSPSAGPNGGWPGGRTTLTTHGAASFNQWFNDVPGMNVTVQFPIALAPTTVTCPETGQITAYGYDSAQRGVGYMSPTDPNLAFFPIDDGEMYGKPNTNVFGNQPPPTNAPTNPPAYVGTHNYSFTFELHTVFTYTGGEKFCFSGDDDVFVYINKQLVINLGGVHLPESQGVNVDSLNLQTGGQYQLDFFSVERHVVLSNVRFTTTLALAPPPPR